MTKNEIKGLLNMVNAAYPSFMRNMTDDERKTQLILWYMMLRNDSAEIVESVIKRYIATNKYPPSVSDIRDGIRQQTMPSVDYLLSQLKDASKQARIVVQEIDGTYIRVDEAKEIFNKMPRELQKYVRDEIGLRNWITAYKANRVEEEKRFAERIIEIQRELDLEQMELGGKYDLRRIESQA